MFNKLMAAHITMNGHQLLPDRGEYIHSVFGAEVKRLDPDSEITRDGEPVYSRYLRRNVRVGDLLPERLALGVNARGEVLRQNDFGERWLQYLRGFGSDRSPELEPIPNVLEYLLKQTDPIRPPDDGRAWYVDLGFNPTQVAEIEQKPRWHPDGVLYEEWKQRHGNPADGAANQRDTRVRLLLELQASGSITAEALQTELQKLYNAPTVGSPPIVEMGGEDVPVTVTGGEIHETAPCGRRVKKGYVNVHRRHCKQAECA